MIIQHNSMKLKGLFKGNLNENDPKCLRIAAASGLI